MQNIEKLYQLTQPTKAFCLERINWHNYEHDDTMSIAEALHVRKLFPEVSLEYLFSEKPDQGIEAETMFRHLSKEDQLYILERMLPE